jgi:hypothetical protein
MPRGALALLALATTISAVLLTYTLLSKIVVIEIEVEGEITKVTVVRGTRLIVSFNNSVTGSPVSLVFEVYGDGFQGVSVLTDEPTLEYYTAGLTEMNDSIRSFKSRELRYCSSQEVRVLIGGDELSFKGACLVIRAKPYISFSS